MTALQKPKYDLAGQKCVLFLMQLLCLFEAVLFGLSTNLIDYKIIHVRILV